MAKKKWRLTPARKRVLLRNRFKGQVSMIQGTVKSILRDSVEGALTDSEVRQILELKRIAKRILESW